MRVLPAVLLAAAALATTGAATRKGRVVRVERKPSRVVEVEAGTFTMGVTPTEAEDLAAVCGNVHGQRGTSYTTVCAQYLAMNGLMLEHDVELSAFAIDRYEVTTDEYRACVDDGDCAIDPLIDGDERYLGDDLPIVNVTWDEARVFCATRGGRLPTEAEWEKAARGDDARPWPWGTVERADDWNHGALPDMAMLAVDDTHSNNWTDHGDPDDSDGFRYASPVGSYLWDEGPYGTHDQAGNVAEWVQDQFDIETGYEGLAAKDPVRSPDPVTGVSRVVRGGSWVDPPGYGHVYARTLQNLLLTAETRSPTIGFRCAYDR